MLSIFAWPRRFEPQGRARGRHHSKLRPKTLGLIQISQRLSRKKHTPKIICLAYSSASSVWFGRYAPGHQFSTARRRLHSFGGGSCEETPRARPQATSGIEEFCRRRMRQPLYRQTLPRRLPGPRPGRRRRPGPRRRTTTAATAGGRARRRRLSCLCLSY